MPKLKNPLLRRKSSSSLPRKKPSISRSSSSNLAKDSPAAAAAQDRLNDTGIPPSLAPRGNNQDVLTLMKYIQENTWNPIPSVSGMGSERISEILRFRASLPPIVSTAHLFALSSSPTAIEREMATLVQAGVLRKISIPGRGKGGGVVGEGVVIVEEWRDLVKSCAGLSEGVKREYLRLLDEAPRGCATTSVRTLKGEEVRELVQAGFLTNPSASAGLAGSGSMDLFASPSSSSGLLNAGFTAPSGSLAAIGGAGAVHEKGGGGSTLATQPHRMPPNHDWTPMTFSLPNTGPYLRLLTSSRSHLLTLLKQLSPRHRECTVDLLREKWEGNVLGDAVSVAKRGRGEWRGVLPGKTRAWREFWGIKFQWVLEEGVGGGVVEVFETGVGVWGVRGR
ncbi:hypothetical protein LTR86_004863 [Recurvomyces mirabilis]|nr:hypothetical protein LTR86_004863 [Recurvomyces mirabilis]